MTRQIDRVDELLFATIVALSFCILDNAGNRECGDLAEAARLLGLARDRVRRFDLPEPTDPMS